MGEDNKDETFVIIPPTVLADKRLSAGEKMVYGRVFGFIKAYGYCKATNEYLGVHIGMSKNTVRNYLSKLYEYGYLRYELVRDEKKEVIDRKIYPTLVPSVVLPSTTPSTPESTEDINKRSNFKNVNKKSSKEIEYYAELVADILNDQKSISYYKAVCVRHDPLLLISKAKEIISDGQAKNPAAVFVAWLKENIK